MPVCWQEGTDATPAPDGGETVAARLNGGLVQVNPEPGGQFGALLRRYRSAACLTQEQVAERSGISVRALSDMERGRTARPFARSIRLLAEALELDPPARARLISAATGSRTIAAVPAAPADRQASAPARAVIPRQLPAAAAHFSGRATELAALAALARQTAGGDAAVVAAIAGTAGVGKTALAIHLGHQVAALFPDGQLYVNLRGFGPSGSPLEPGRAICGFLNALGLPAEQIPSRLEDQAALYRSLLAGRRVLVVLDNALDEDQVRPLLPGSAGCMGIVTSRRKLVGLVAIEGAHHIGLDVLTEPEARQLLIRRIGYSRVAGNQQAAAELLDLCAGLPLALAIAASRAAVSPSALLTTLVAQIRDADNRLDALEDSDQLASIRAVFSWSYHDLSPAAARLFRLLSVHPGPDISLPCAASLGGIGRRATRQLLKELTSASLLTEHSAGRYAFHDLMRAYSAEKAAQSETEGERAAAMDRVLDHYLHTAHRAASLLNPSREPASLSSPRAGTQAEEFGNRLHAMEWFTAEHQALLAVAGYAATSGSDLHASQLPRALETFLARQARGAEQADTQRAALVASRRLAVWPA
jgi:transcriptional regulator with XRE-family HTH domain